MTPGTSWARRARARAAAATARGRDGRDSAEVAATPAPAACAGDRRHAVVAALGAFLLVNSDRFQRTLEEVTLPLQHEDIIRQQAAEKDVPADLIAAVIYASRISGTRPPSAGARGLMQITPATAQRSRTSAAARPSRSTTSPNPDLNIRYGTFYLRYLIQKFGDNEVAALAAYNAGETNVVAWGGSSLRLDDIASPRPATTWRMCWRSGTSTRGTTVTSSDWIKRDRREEDRR